LSWAGVLVVPPPAQFVFVRATAERWNMELPWWLLILAIVLALAAILDFIGALPRL